MTRSKQFFLGSPVLILALLGIACLYWVGRSDTLVEGESIQEQSSVDVGSSPAAVRVFIFGNGDPNDPLEGDQSYEDSNSLGVAKPVVDALPSHMPDFEFIGNQMTAREQYLAQNGIVASDPDLVWQTVICETGVVNGEQRLAVGSSLGRDKAMNGGVALEDFQDISEIWQLVSGGDPALMERTLDFHVGLNTHAEVPIFNPTGSVDADYPPIGPSAETLDAIMRGEGPDLNNAPND